MLEIIGIIWIPFRNSFRHKTISYKELVGTGKKQLNFSDINLEEATNMQLKMQM